MANPQSPFESDYTEGSQTTPPETAAAPDAPTRVPFTGIAAQTVPVQTTHLPPMDQLLIEPARYGIGKPRRVTIRGKITREPGQS